MKQKNESRTNAVHVLICGQPIWLDMENLKDAELAMCNRATSEYEIPDGRIHAGEQHFSHQNASIAAKKQDKRLLTHEEQEFITSLPCRWDDNGKGMWITFDKVEGDVMEIFFPAAGIRSNSDERLEEVGIYGYYCSATIVDNYICTLDFSSSYITLSFDYTQGVLGTSVRCASF
ncbi:MAG: hypothetical protein LBG80_04505 [Bacteroidales bacterium]|jgi:hypothetical protein|nr:hypothetical protein [Bacteroidales bacterium]